MNAPNSSTFMPRPLNQPTGFVTSVYPTGPRGRMPIALVRLLPASSDAAEPNAARTPCPGSGAAVDWPGCTRPSVDWPGCTRPSACSRSCSRAASCACRRWSAWIWSSARPAMRFAHASRSALIAFSPGGSRPCRRSTHARSNASLGPAAVVELSALAVPPAVAVPPALSVPPALAGPGPASPCGCVASAPCCCASP